MERALRGIELIATYAGYPAELIDVIVQFAQKAALPPLLLLALGLGESSLDPEAVGDGGQSYGVYQIHVPAHGGPPGRWTGIAGAQAAMAQMHDRWRNAFGVAGGQEAWEANPAAFLAAWWPRAQGSIEPAPGRVYEVLRDAGPIWEAYQMAHAPTPTLQDALDGLTLLAQSFADLSAQAAASAAGARALVERFRG